MIPSLSIQPQAVQHPLYPAKNPQKSHPQPVRFGGVGDMVASFIAHIDKNRAMELFASDGLGMLLPRTVVAASFRGVDDGRETLIREGAGLVCVALLAGLTNQLMTRVLGNRVGLYNPHGTPANAWISAANLRVFGNLYNQELGKQNSLPQARKAFINQVLNGLQSGDRYLSLEGQLAAIKKLSATSPEGRATAEKAIERMVIALPGKPENVQTFQTLFQTGNFTELKKEFLKSGWGQLSPQGLTDLAAWLNPRKASAAAKNAVQPGTVNFDRLAWQEVHKTQKNVSGKALEQAFLKTRLDLSLAHLTKANELFVKELDDIALKQGLTSVVHVLKEDGKNVLKGDGKNLLDSQSRGALLTELKHFLEHYVDRAAFAVTHNAEGKKLATLPTLELQKKLMREKLFGPPAKGLGKLWPKASDGLVTAMLKSKFAYTAVPIAVAIIANGVTTFLNNYVTQKKYGGKIFFPGEEAYLNAGRPVAVAPPRPLTLGRMA